LPEGRPTPLAVLLLVAIVAPGAPESRAQPLLPGQDESAPIEIVADTLVVHRGERLAVFSGNVDATQGERSLRADELKVFYGEERPGGGQGIRRIEAIGRVVIAEPGQTAQGDRGVYDPEAGKIRLDGNVVLTRGDNVVRGGQLEMDLATGTAVVRAAKPGGAPGERVRALFVPREGPTGGRPAAAERSREQSAR